MTPKNRYLASGPDQISYVTSDLSRAMETFREMLGVFRFFQMKNFELSNQRFQVESEPMLIDFAIAWTGTIFLEIIQPLKSDLVYGPYLKPDGFTLTLHHIAFAVEDWDTLQRELKAEGRSLSFSGELQGMLHSGYLDCRDTLGYYVEFYSATPAGKTQWEKVRDGDF